MQRLPIRCGALPTIALFAGAVVAASGAARADSIAGILTADVDMASPELFGGTPFAAVVNPDAVYPGAVQGVNVSGVAIGPTERPDQFVYMDLPVYAVVDSAGSPWAYGDPLFAIGGDGNEDRGSPLFELAFVGSLSLDFRLETDRYYSLLTGSFVHDQSGSVVQLAGGAEFLEPFGAPSFLWYGLGGIGLSLYDASFGAFGMMGNNDLWSSGWPGVTLDKNFFPIPSPASLTLLVLGGVFASRRTR